MAIIVISRGNLTRGKEVAGKTAEKLGYRCISREVLLEASEEFNVPEIKLIQSIDQVPSFFDRMSQKAKKYVTYIQSALLHNLQQGNVVYHGFAGHFFVQDNPHVIKVRVNSGMSDRVRLVMERDGVSEKQALAFLKKIDALRKKWSRKLYGMDPEDSSHYDLVVLLSRLTVEDAADLICQAARLQQFSSTSESKKIMDDMVLAADARTLLLGMKSNPKVWARDGVLYVRKGGSGGQNQELVEKLGELAKKFPEARGIELVQEKGNRLEVGVSVGRGKATRDVAATFFGEL